MVVQRKFLRLDGRVSFATLKANVEQTNRSLIIRKWLHAWQVIFVLIA